MNGLIGVIDLLRGYPNNETAMLGLLLLKEEHRSPRLNSDRKDRVLLR